jgi:hypothetical protein
MRRMTALFVCLGGLLLAAGLVRGDGPDRITIPHRLHAEAEVECEVCHAGAAEAASAAVSLLPDMDVCADCHDVEDDGSCALCHSNVDAAGETERPAHPAGRFSHRAHVDRGMACAGCHGDPRAAEPGLPAKALCRSCHETAPDYADCGLCHEPPHATPASHDRSWLHVHGLEAHGDPGRCDGCHTRSQCQDCHAGDDVRPRAHPLNWTFQHALAARSGDSDCQACHQEPAFCSGCHAAERILPRSHARADWVRAPDGGRHAEDGLFELESCIACHDDGAGSPLCSRCHGG